MARARNIKPGFFANDVLAECDPLARLLFAGLWTIADRAGRLEERPKRIKADLLPYDECDVTTLLDQLVSRGFIERYTAQGKCYLQIVTWGKHQNPHIKESASEIPAPDKNSSSTVLASDGTHPEPAPARLIPDSGILIPDSPTHGGVVDSSPTKAGAICNAIRGKGIADVNPSNPELLALIAKGVPSETFEAAAETCRKSSPTKGMAYLLGIVRRQLVQAAEIAAGPSAVVTSLDPDSRSAIEAEGIAKGIGAWNELNEQWHLYKGRVRGKALGLDLGALAGMAALRQGATA